MLISPASFRRFSALAVVIAALVLYPVLASAQQETGFDTSKQWTIEQLGKNHVKLTGAVEAQRGEMKFFADEIESWTDTNRVVATGNVVFSDGPSRIAADRADFNTETRLGTFFNATGSAVLGEPKRDALGGRDADVYFYGDEIEKIGDKKYKIKKGGFTTCLQPTPRWQVTSSTVILNLDHYAFLTNAMLKAKNVPVFYFPVLYYPINKEDRATGFLMPAYGTSTYRGFTLSNAFFWAISRSQDATFMHDWFSKRGNGLGTEYRYVAGPGSQGFFRFYKLTEHESTLSNGQTLAGSNSYEVRGNASYMLGGGWSARGRVDYFTSLQTQQLYHTNIYDASRSQRTISGGVSGSLLGLGITASYDRSEYFNGRSNSALTGGAPRITITRGERPLFGSLVYFSVNGEYADLLRQYKNDADVTNNGLQRMDVGPVIRVPFTKLRWMTVNSSVTWHGTYWTRSLDPAANNAVVNEPITRSFFDLQSRITGPVFNRVWNTPDNGYAEKWKHSVEPFFNIQRITAVDNFDRIVKLDGLDYTLGRTTRIDYGVNNRLMAKRKGGPASGSARDFVAVTITQTYYTDARASQYDYNYSSSFSTRPPSKFSPIRLAATVSPTERLNGTLRAEYDQQAHIVQSISANGQAAAGEWLSVTAGYSQRKLKSIEPLRAYTNDNFLNASATLRSPSNRVGGVYTFSYDIGRSTMLTNRIVTYYNAQCCGVAFEYQTYNFPGSYAGITKDRRFNFSFTLAGLGTFSNFFGALGGVTR